MTDFTLGMAFGIAVTALYRRIATDQRTRDLDERLADYERERGRRRGAGEQGLMKEVL